MKRKYIVLETPSSRTSEPFGSENRIIVMNYGHNDNFRSNDIEILKPTLTVEELTQSELVSRSKENGVRAIAPADMPTILIEPLISAESEAEDSALSAWGISAVGAEQSPFSGKDVTVAVLDTGIDRNHPAFSDMTLIEKDFSSSGNGDIKGHGTHCAGTIFGRDVDGIRIGVAPGLEKAFIGKVLDNNGRGNLQMLTDGIKWAADNGADVISMSLGFDIPGLVASMVANEGLPMQHAISIALQDYRAVIRFLDSLLLLIKNAAVLSPGKDPVIVAATGNESRRNLIEPEKPYTVGVSIPAATEGIIAVAALAQKVGGLEIASFSNIYPQLSAPGVEIVSAKTGGGLKKLSGTSMACPHVAGLAALYWEKVRKEMNRASSKFVVSELLSNASRREIINFTPDDCGRGIAKAPNLPV